MITCFPRLEAAVIELVLRSSGTKWRPRSAFVVVFLLTLPGVINRNSLAQQSFEIGGLAYLDYYYVLSSPDEEEEGDNGFTYRRLYLTTDYRISEAFQARVRLEANEETVTENGPVPFVKDLYLRWSSNTGHRLTFGVTSPPSFDVLEDSWGYRSLEKTVMDFFDIVSSRDMGVRAEGPILADDRLKYAVMVGNNESVQPEDDRHKRVYGQLIYKPIEKITGTLGLDYATYDDERDDGLTWNTSLSLVESGYRIGAEAFLNRTGLEAGESYERFGVSLFTVIALAKKWEVVGRYDRFIDDDLDRDFSTHLFLGGIAFEPHEQIRFIPNLEAIKQDGADKARVWPRLTLEMHF